MESKKFIEVLGNICVVLVLLFLAIEYALKVIWGGLEYVRILLLGHSFAFGEVGLICFIWLIILIRKEKRMASKKE